MTPAMLRPVLVAIAYLVMRLATALAGSAFGAPLHFDPVGETAAALVVGVTLVALADRSSGGRGATFGALLILAFGSVAAVMLEGAAFAPELSPIGRLPLGLALQLAVSAAAAAVAVLVGRGASTPPAGPGRLAVRRSVRGILVGGLVYVVAYFVTGAMDYALVTGPYYAAHAGGLVRPAVSTVLTVAVIEGIGLAAASLPLAVALPGSRWSVGLACGLALWALGGVAPLLQASNLPDVVRLASVPEILLQKVPLALALVWVLRPARPAAWAPRVAGAEARP